MKLLTFSTLYPNSASPHHGIFVETSLRHIVASGAASARVVAPVPWFPFQHPCFGRYATYASAPLKEMRSGLEVTHPRYPVVPKLGMSIAPFALAQAAKAEIGRILDEGYAFDVIDAHYFYPDGAAAVMLGRYFGKPVVITALGSDINLLPRYAFPRRMIRWAAENAAGVVTVSHALKVKLAALGIDSHRITVCRNGVDLDLFHPSDRSLARARFGCQDFTLASVGNLVATKGHDLVISALPALPGVTLLIAGIGPERGSLEQLGRRLGVAERVHFVGAMPQSELRNVYVAADALVLASSREGWANVLLESMACGTPVIASNVGGTPEVVQTADAGIIMAQRSSKGILDAVAKLRLYGSDREATRRYAEQFSWEDTTQTQIKLFNSVMAKPSSNAAAGSATQSDPVEYDQVETTI